MNPLKVQRAEVRTLTDLPNVGKACAADLRLIGIERPEQLKGRDPYDLFAQLCAATGAIHDPCTLDVFISLTRFMDGEAPRPWWDYTQERKQALRNKSSP